MDLNNFQRIGAISNSHAGSEFEEIVQRHWQNAGIHLERNFVVQIGFKAKRPHKFDLGSNDPSVLIECKSYTWTSGGNTPSAKIRGMNEVMLHFSVAPESFRKILFVLRDMRGTESLAAYYVRTQSHLLVPDVEVWEFDMITRDAIKVI